MKKSDLIELIRKVVREEMKIIFESINKQPTKTINEVSKVAAKGKLIEQKPLRGQITAKTSESILEQYAQIKGQELKEQVGGTAERADAIDNLIKKQFGV